MTFMKLCLIALAILSLSAGCAVFRAPVARADGPTLPTGTYDSTAEKWADESLAAQRKAEKEKVEETLTKIDR